MVDQVMNHDIDRGQRFDQIHHQGFGRGFRVYGKQGTDGARGGLDVGGRGEVVIEGAFGGFVEFLNRVRMGMPDRCSADLVKV
jgi:hypothetical protein